MKKIILALSTLAVIVSCKKGGNKDVLPAEDTQDTVAVDSGVVETPTETETVAVGTLDANGNFIYEVGELVDVTLPNGKVLNVGQNSTENKLYTFLADANQTVNEDKTQGWITLDRVYFDTGNSTLTAESQKQVDNLAAILEAYPNAVIKIGGYTDNVGNAEVNQPLSQKRAESVLAAIKAKGIAANRLSAEGYGQEHPICPANDTDECKAQNRRVDIRVAKK